MRKEANRFCGTSSIIQSLRLSGGFVCNENDIPANKYHKLYVENCFLVLYQIKDDTVYVDWIVDCRQDYRWLLK